MTDDAIRYRTALDGTDEVARAIRTAVTHLEDENSEFRADLASVDVSLEQVIQNISVSPTASGIDAGDIALIISFAPFMNHALRSLWDKYIVKQVRDEAGEDALEVEKDSDGEPEN